MHSIDVLEQEVKAWREATPRHTPPKDPAAQQLHELNQAWSKVKADNDARIATERAEYLAERERLLKILQDSKPAEPRAKLSPGRPRRHPYPDSLKVAAYRASVETSRSMVRTMLALTNRKDSALLDATLAEGKILAEQNPIRADFELKA